MKQQNKIFALVEKAKQKKVVLLLSLIYNFVWAICKIVFGAYCAQYFFCVSGASTLLIGFVKRVYLKHHKSDDLEEKRGKSVIISILLIASAALFTFYMARLFFISDAKEYGLILSISIAAFSFAELVLSICNFLKASKTNDILFISLKGCGLASSCFAIVLTQVALLSATGSTNNFYNALTGVIFGSFAIIIGIIILVKSMQFGTHRQKDQNSVQA